MISEDHQLLPRVVHWITDIKRQMGNAIRNLVETEKRVVEVARQMALGTVEPVFAIPPQKY